MKWIVALLLVALELPFAKASSCNALASSTLSRAKITSAETVPPASDLPAFCRVKVILAPSEDSEIRMELWLPRPDQWNGKLEALGNGGWSGSINASALATGLRRGYAATMSDLGHEGSRAEFALGHPEKLIDFGYRAAHETTVAAKALIAAYYGQSSKHSYWSGCSAGGRSALMEAQRYPTDFDGIIAGAPGLNWTGRAIRSIQVAQIAHRSEDSYIPPAKYALVHQAVLNACDAKDGAADGVLENPRQCGWDPTELQCSGADAPACLTPSQAETARAMYRPLLDPKTRSEVFPGFERGSELNWGVMAGPQPFTIGTDYFRFVIFQNPDWSYHNFDLNLDLTRAQQPAPILNATDPNLKAFREHRGKLIQYHGWEDGQIAPGVSPAYYSSVLDTMGGQKQVDSFYRLFMVPGMGHCGGGEGTSTFDSLSALESWVEKGQAPDRISASRLKNGKVDRTRPLCPYPQVARYKGSGSIDEAVNFACVLP